MNVAISREELDAINAQVYGLTLAVAALYNRLREQNGGKLPETQNDRDLREVVASIRHDRSSGYDEDGKPYFST